MTRLEIIKKNKELYRTFSEQIKDMTGLTKLVAETITLEWIKGNNWMGGISDSKYEKLSDKLVAMGYDWIEIYQEFDYQITSF